MEEIWRHIINYENYEVSNAGNFRNLKTGHTLLIAAIQKNGYAKIDLSKNGTAKTFRAHILVAKHFVANPQNFPIVNHKDGVKHHNWADNLEWTTHSGNSKHAYEMGLRVSPSFWKNKRGSEHNRSVAIKMLDANGRTLKTFGSLLEAERETKINHQNISKCCKNERKSAGGYAWQYGC